MKPILKKHKAISEYVRLTGGRLSANFTHQYLPLFYSGNTLDIVMQNIIIALLGNLLQHIGSLSLIKTVSISIPAIKLAFFLPGWKTDIKATSTRLKQSFFLFRVDQLLIRLGRNSKALISQGKYRYNTSLGKFGYEDSQTSTAASA